MKVRNSARKKVVVHGDKGYPRIMTSEIANV